MGDLRTTPDGGLVPPAQMFALCGAMIVVGIAYIAVAPRPAPAQPVAKPGSLATELAASATPVTGEGDGRSSAKARSVLDAQAREAGAADSVVTITPTAPTPAPPSTTTTMLIAPTTTVDPLSAAAVATAAALVNTVDTVLSMTLSTAAPTTVAPVVRVAGHNDAGVASWFNAPEGTCAHRTLARGTMVKVTRVSTGAVASCRINDWGPTVATGRIIDLSMDTFAALAPTSAGLLDVTIEW